jgi:hypothetical protein
MGKQRLFKPRLTIMEIGEKVLKCPALPPEEEDFDLFNQLHEIEQGRVGFSPHVRLRIDFSKIDQLTAFLKGSLTDTVKYLISQWSEQDVGAFYLYLSVCKILETREGVGTINLHTFLTAFNLSRPEHQDLMKIWKEHRRTLTNPKSWSV